MVKSSLSIKRSLGDISFVVGNYTFLTVLSILMIYPFWHMIMYSLSEVEEAFRGGFFLWPRGLELGTYKAVLRNRSLLNGFQVSVLVTVSGTAIGTFFTATTAYPLSRKTLRGRTLFTFIIFFTMLFHGGMIPTYLVIKGLRMLDSIWALILPLAITPWNFFLMRNFFNNIPNELEESARMDGASDIVIFFRIILPLSTAIIATISLFLAVIYWNDFFSTILYINTRTRRSMQAVLNEIIYDSSTFSEEGVNVMGQRNITPVTVRMASIIITTVPILLVYPFVQKYFVKGVMVGSLKG